MFASSRVLEARIAGVVMGRALSIIREFFQGSASWDFIRHVVWPMIGSLIPVIWGWFLSFPGPILFQLALTTFAIGLFLQQTWKRRKEKLIAESDTDGSLEQIHRKEIDNLRETIQTLTTQKTDLESRINVLTKQLNNTLTARKIVDFIKDIKERAQRIPIRIVATERYELLARILIDVFLITGYEVMLNNDKTDHIIPAHTIHNRTIIRYRKRADNSDIEDVARNILCAAIASSLIQLTGCTEHPFPSTSNIDYIQIEVGGAP